MTQAASELHLTQSAVSHQLHGIEERLGTALFLRVGKRMVATAAGERVLEAARRVLDDIRAAEEDVRRLARGEAERHPRLRAVQYRVSLAAAARRRLPPEASRRSKCRSRSNARCGRWRRLLDGLLDVAIVTHIRPQQPRSGRGRSSRTSMPPSSRPTIASPRRPSSARKTLPTERLLLYSSSPDDSFTIQKILQPGRRRARRVSFVMLTEAILEMVKARLGVSVMQTWAIAPALRAGDVRAVPITAAGIRRQWRAATLTQAGRVPHVDAFIDLLAARAMPARRRPLTVSRARRR